MPSKKKSLWMSAWQREHWGITATFKNADGELLTLHRKGKSALREACDAALIVDPTYRVVTISTPSSIATDLRGREPGSNGFPVRPEASQLGYQGLGHMLHPECRGSSDQSRSRWH